MTYKNAYQGVKRIFTAELLKLIGAACLLICAIAGVLALGSAVVGSESGLIASGALTLVFLIGGLVLTIIGYILNLVGLNQAGKDEDNFRGAFLFSIFALVISVVSMIFTLLNVGGGIADNIATTVSRICEIIVFVLVVIGITNLAENLGKTDMIGSGSKLMIIYITAYGIGILANLIVGFFGANETTATISGILGIVSAIFSIIAYIVYLVFLGKAKAMLRDN